MAEFNLNGFQYIWGFTPNAQWTPSFHTWDDIYVYYNPTTKQYHMHIDTGIYQPEPNAWVELGRLSEIESAFRNFLIENGHPIDAEICYDDFQSDGAPTLSALYVKFKIIYDGYKEYVNNKPQS